MCSRIKCRKCGAESYAAGDTGLVCIRCYNQLEVDRAKLVENNDLLHEYIEQNRITQLVERIKELETALESIWPFIKEDFPKGTGDNHGTCATDSYVLAARQIEQALEG